MLSIAALALDKNIPVQFYSQQLQECSQTQCNIGLFTEASAFPKVIWSYECPTKEQNLYFIYAAATSCHNG